MSNRQARREQSRQARSQRSTRGSRPGPTRPKRSGSGTFSRSFVFGVVVVVIALAAVLVTVAAMTGGGSNDLVRALEDGRTPADIEQSGLKLGSDDAPIKLAMYEDFQCAFCVAFTAEDKSPLVEEYVRTGKLQMEYKFLPVLGPESTAAALASYCASEQDRFWPYHDELYIIRAKDSDGRNNNGRFSDRTLRDLAGDVGMDLEEYDSCIISSRALNYVQDTELEAGSLGLTGTPSFAVNGQALGNDPGSMANWRTVLDAIYENVTGGTTTPTEGATPEATATPE